MKSLVNLGVVAVGAALAFTVIQPVFAQQQFPVKPIRMLVPASAGGGTDFIARTIGQKISENWASQWWWRTGRALAA